MISYVILVNSIDLNASLVSAVKKKTNIKAYPSITKETTKTFYYFMICIFNCYFHHDLQIKRHRSEMKYNSKS